jgi:hypothetical protein
VLISRVGNQRPAQRPIGQAAQRELVPVTSAEEQQNATNTTLSIAHCAAASSCTAHPGSALLSPRLSRRPASSFAEVRHDGDGLILQNTVTAPSDLEDHAQAGDRRAEDPCFGGSRATP